MNRTRRALLTLATLVVGLTALTGVASAAAPVNTTPPAASGAAEIGATLTSSFGTWVDNPRRDFFWAICETDELDLDFDCWTSSSSRTFTVDEGEVGRYIFRVERAHNDDGSTVVGSDPIGPIVDPARPFKLGWWQRPGNLSADTDPMFQLSADRHDIGDLDLVCTLDNLPSVSCPSSFAYGGLLPGEHTITVTATDGAERTETIEFEWVITQGPAVAFLDVPRAVTRNRYPEFYWGVVGNDADGFECKLDDEDWDDCDDWGYAELEVRTPGDHTFSVRAYTIEDEVREYPSPAATHNWKLDRTSPKLTSTVPATLNADPYDLVFTADEELRSIYCTIDDGDGFDCLDGMTISGLGSGWHTLRVELEDLADNSNDYYFDFGIDVGATVATITSRPNHYTSKTSATVSFTASEGGATFECSFDDQETWSACTSPVQFNNLEYGDEPEFAVRAIKNGHTQEYPASFHWHVTERPFDLYFDDNPDWWTSSHSARFEVYADRDVSISELALTCSLDGAAFTPCTSQTELDGLDYGEHTFKVKATLDGEEEEISYAWTVSDEFAARWGSKPSEFDSNSNTYFDWQTSGDFDSTRCNFDNSGWGACTENWSHTVSGLSEGQHTLGVKFLNASDEEIYSLDWTWTADWTPPTVTAGTPPTITAFPAVLPFTTSEPLGEIWCSIDNKQWKKCTWPITVSGLANGNHNIRVDASDRADNWIGAVLEMNFTVALADPPVDPPVTPVTPITAKPSIGKLAKPGKGKLSVPWTCDDATCTVSAKIKAGKKTIKLKSKKVNKGSGKLTFKLSKSQQKTLKKVKKKKSTLTVTVSGASGKASKKLKF